MKTIIIQTDDPDRSRNLIDILALLFPECRIEIVLKRKGTTERELEKKPFSVH